jgi:hypothetical protein
VKQKEERNMPTGREDALSELRAQELERAKKIVEVNRKMLKEAREVYMRLLAGSDDQKAAAAYDEVLEAVRWNYVQSADWLCKLERSMRVGILSEEGERL